MNPGRKPGEWQTYDVVWTAPTFNADGSLKTPAYVTVFFNGVLVQNHFELKGQTLYIGKPYYKAYDRGPHQAPGPRRQERTHQLQKHLGKRIEVEFFGSINKQSGAPGASLLGTREPWAQYAPRI